MLEPSDTNDRAAACGTCGGPLQETRYALVDRAWLELACSEACFGAARRRRSRRRWAARRRVARRFTMAVVLVGACLTPHRGPPGRPRADRTAATRARVSPGPPPLPPGWFGPEWPPTETSLLAALGRDAWVHPLAGPVRRMPRSDTRVFGAERPGNRAIECRNGHCGVDLGGEIWGEHVHAVHDGIVDWVQRGANAEHGGQFVRLSHRGGTVFTQYFHLAAIPRGLERGVSVKGGDVIGLLGDSGVKESEPHLHFTLSVKPAKDWPEKYVDPEPLIALWPLRVPLDGSETGLVTTVAQPGVPLGSAALKPGHRRRLAKTKRAADEAVGDQGEASTRTAPAQDEAAPEGASPEAPAEE